MRTPAPPFEHHPVLDSTSDRVLELARTGAPPFTWVVADAQRKGRGRQGRPWVSRAGAGLWMSVLLPEPPGGPPGVVPLAVGVAVAEALEVLGVERVRLKWPNDLVLVAPTGATGEGGLAKLGGILCERAPGRKGGADPRGATGAGEGGSGGIVAGIGVNLAIPPLFPASLEGGALPPAAARVSGAGAPLASLVLARAVMEALGRWADPPPDRLEGALRKAWSARDALVGRQVQVIPGPRGEVRGVGEDGSLQLVTPRGRESIRAGTVRLL